MTFFTASLETVALRFFLMMAVIIGSFFGGVPYLAVLALPIFLSALAAVSFGKTKEIHSTQMNVHKQDTTVSNAA